MRSVKHWTPWKPLTCLITTLLGGCDIMYGVSRHAPLPALPDLACVESVIREAPGVQKTDYKISSEFQRFTWSGIPKAVPPYTYTYHYTGSSPEIYAHLEITDDSRGHVDIRQCLLSLNRPPDPTVVAATRPVMQHIELELAARCGLEHLPDVVKESCRGVDCPRLTDARAPSQTPIAH
jgi:hypothetical protein